MFNDLSMSPKNTKKTSESNILQFIENQSISPKNIRKWSNLNSLIHSKDTSKTDDPQFSPNSSKYEPYNIKSKNFQ